MKTRIYLLTAALLGIMTACHNPSETATRNYQTEETLYLTEAGADSLHLFIRFDVPVHMKSASAQKDICRDILTQVFGEAFAAMEPQHALEAYAAMLKTEYKQNNLPMVAERQGETPETETFPVLCEEQYLDGQVIGTVRNLMSYGVERYVYTGGAHGISYRLFRNYDISNGKVIQEADLFTCGSEDAITEMLKDNIIAQSENISSTADLQAEGYSVEDIRPNNNFYLSEEGIVYVFNPYDIAPYSYGETEVMLTWEQLEPLLTKEQ